MLATGWGHRDLREGEPLGLWASAQEAPPQLYPWSRFKHIWGIWAASQ